MLKNTLLVLTLIFSVSNVFAQKGFLRGIVSEDETGETLIGATVSIKGTATGTVTDFNGNYSLSLAPGSYSIQFQFVSFQTITVDGVEIIADEVNKLDVALGSNVEELAAVVVSAKVIKNTDAALLNVQKKSATVVDGISSQAFRKIGDSNLSGAMKRVTGVSVQGGKYVYVRGLGDRYTRTTLNGMSIPGLDPERNDVQIDLFPTSVLENVMVYKTFSPDLAGDFSGGTVNVSTKSFPEEKITSLSFGLGYNPGMNLNSDFVLYKGSGTDFLGFDNGQRNQPINQLQSIPRPTSAGANSEELLETITSRFDPKMAAETQTSFANTSFSVNHGNQLDVKGFKIGYGVVFNYQNKYQYFDDTEFSLYFKDDNKDIDNLDPQVIRKGELGRSNVLWSGLVTGAIKFDYHEIGLTFLKTQNGITEATKRISRDFEETGQTVYEDILTYSQRSITSPTLYGNHNFNKLTVKWLNTVTFARVYDPDFRSSLIAEVPVFEGSEQVSETYSISGGQGGGANRFWRNLNETNENFRVDATYKLREKVKLKFGAAGLFKWREFETYAYSLQTSSGVAINNDANDLLSETNIWTAQSETGIYVSGNFEAANNYDARSSVTAGYVMADAFLTTKFRAIFGARVENAQMFYTGQDNLGQTIYNDEKTLDEINILPSLNTVYSITDNINLRGSYGRTLARPSFREKSIAQILDPVSGIRFSGNIDLQQTNIDNFDFRLESFFRPNEMAAISLFYKRFDGHIEQTRFEKEPSEVSWQNIGGSTVYGIEIEFRKNLDRILRGLAAGTNISLASSRVDMNEIIVDRDAISGEITTEYQSRLAQARTAEDLDETRVMAGQAPYLINVFVSYTDEFDLTSANLSYNVQGRSLSVVGVGQVPDVYVRPFNSLNFNASRKVGQQKKGQVSFRVDNILGDKQEQVWANHDAEEEIFSRFSIGRTFTATFQYTF
jgi:hypothetical protein